jgi:hypothetical protein
MKTEEYVLQTDESYDHDYIEVRGTDGGYSTSSYMNDVKHYDSLKLAKLAVEALHCRHPKMKVKILKIAIEEVKDA